ncbi:MAG: hypothetical protein H7144_01625 [Burkholderiales bacterium]|nr:hypothetical protein [Phycisphaerae bacterium]
MNYGTVIASLAAVSVVSSMALAQAGPEMLLKPMDKALRFDGSASGAYFFETDTSADDTEATLIRYGTSGRLRLMPEHKADPRFGYSFQQLNLDTDNDLYPSEFTSIQVGVGTGIAEFDNGWVAGLTLGGGYAGTNTFGDANAWYAAGTVLVGGKIDDRTTLGFALDYDGNRSFMPDVPLPGIVWTRQIPERNLELSVGFPFAYSRWRPTEELLLELNFTFPDFVGARVSYDLVKGVGLFASLSQRTDAWHHNDLPRGDDRILFEQSMAELGARFSLDDRFTVLFAGGYAFAQEFRTGFDSRETDEFLELDDTPFLRLEGEFRF